MLFEWDVKKAEANLKKHGVSFEEAATVFDDPDALELPDGKHSTPAEIRSFRLGKSAMERTLLVVFTERGRKSHDKEIIRIISARPASRKEKEVYFTHRSDKP